MAKVDFAQGKSTPNRAFNRANGDLAAIGLAKVVDDLDSQEMVEAGGSRQYQHCRSQGEDECNNAHHDPLYDSHHPAHRLNPIRALSLEVLPNAEIHLPLSLIARLLERNSNVDSYRANGRIVTERRTGGKVEVRNGYIVGVSRQLAEVQEDRAGQLLPNRPP